MLLQTYYSIFQQLFKFIPRYRFENSVKNISGDRYSKKISAWQQFLTCLYTQITGKPSLFVPAFRDRRDFRFRVPPSEAILNSFHSPNSEFFELKTGVQTGSVGFENGPPFFCLDFRGAWCTLRELRWARNKSQKEVVPR